MPESSDSPEKRPPWVYVVVLPDDTPPSADDLLSLPLHSKIIAMCAEAAETTIIRIGYDLAKQEYEVEMEQGPPDPDHGS